MRKQPTEGLKEVQDKADFFSYYVLTPLLAMAHAITFFLMPLYLINYTYLSILPLDVILLFIVLGLKRQYKKITKMLSVAQN